MDEVRDALREHDERQESEPDVDARDPDAADSADSADDGGSDDA